MSLIDLGFAVSWTEPIAPARWWVDIHSLSVDSIWLDALRIRITRQKWLWVTLQSAIPTALVWNRLRLWKLAPKTNVFTCIYILLAFRTIPIATSNGWSSWSDLWYVWWRLARQGSLCLASKAFCAVGKHDLFAVRTNPIARSLHLRLGYLLQSDYATGGFELATDGMFESSIWFCS